MDQNQNVQQLVARQNSSEKFSDEKTKNKIDKHLSDINDKITDEDIKNVITDINVIKSAIKEEEEENTADLNSAGEDENTESSKDSSEYQSDKDKKKTTPWDMLDA